ncbi:phage tail spike protein [Streptococcus mitis]|uniref:phage tail spike protein n=1 Tax=Streptococcus mitis TaxID=28037 RepID=UPI0021B5ED06|nr:phage tail spike protein [Streptococcus mitis]
MIYLTEGNTPLNEAYNDEIVQERNNTYQLTFRFPTSDPKWELLREETFLTADDLHGEQDFYIFEVEKQQGYIQVYANQVISLLNNYIVSSIDVDRVSGTRALSALAGSITRANPFSFFSDIDDRHTLNIKDKNAMEVLAKDKHSILGQWGGDMVRNGYNLRLLKNGGSENESLFMYKKNLSSYQHKTSTKSLKTRITFKTTVKGEGEKAPDVDYVVVIDSPLLGKYSQIYEAVVEVNDQNVKDKASLIEYGKQYFRTSMCDMLEDNLEISVVGQSDVAVRMFDVVSIYHEWYGLDVRKKITKYTYSPMAKRLKSIGFGTFQSSLANAIGGIVNDAVLNESRNLHQIFEERLKKEIANADRAFDAEFAKREKDITDAIELAKAKAEEVKQDISNEIDKRFQNFDNASIQEARRKAEEALKNAGASSLLAQEAKRIGLDSVAKLEEFKRQAMSAQTALLGDLDVLKRTVASDIRPKQAQAEAEIAKQVEALVQTKKELAGVKSAQATYEETTTRRLSELANVADGKASKSELTQTAEELASKIANVKVGGRNYYRDSEKVRTSTRFFPFPLHPYLSQENVGEIWTLSFDLKINEGGEIRPLHFYHYQTNRFGLKASADITPSKDWQRFTFTGPVIFPNDDPRYSRGEMALYDYGGNNNYSVRRIKLEKGTLATDWSPAIEDTDGQISAVESNFKQRADALDAGVRRLTEGLRTKADISSLNVTAENIRQSVKSLETDTQDKLNQKLSLAEFEVRAGSIRQEILNATKDKADKTLVVAEAGKLREEFSNLRVGGRNYYRDSEKVRTSTRFFSFPLHLYLTQENVGETWTLSFDLKINEGGEIRPLLFYHYQTNRFGLKASANITPSKEWQRFTFTGPVIFPNDDPRYSRGEMALYDYGGNNNYSVRRIKLEKGTLATDWSPAIEDTDGLITEAKAIFERTAQGLRTDLSAIQEYVNKDGQRQEALQRYTREESAKQATAVRELVEKDYVGKATYQETVKAIEHKFEAITNPQNGSIATQIATYKNAVDGRFADITSLIAGKANQTDFQRVKETSQLYERIIGSNENDISNKVARMAMTNQLFQVEVGKAFAEHQNLFLTSTLTKGFLGNNGIISVANATQKEVTSDFISVNPNEKIIFQHWVTLPENGMAWTAWQFFDKNKNPIDNRKPGLNAYKTTVGKQHNINQITVPANAYFVRFSARMYDDGLIKVEKGSTPSDYSVAPNDALEAVKTVQTQLAGSWAVQNINSAGDIISGINLGANGHNRFDGKLTHITGETLIDKAVIKSAMIDKLKTANFEAGSVTTAILDAEAVTAEKIKVDQAFFNKFVANEAYLKQLFAKQAFINRVQSVAIDASQVSSGVLSGDRIYGGTIRGSNIYGGTLTGHTQIQLGSYGSFDTVNGGLQINVPRNYNAKDGLGVQFIGSYGRGENVPYGLFVYKDSDFTRGNTATPTTEFLLTVEGYIKANGIGWMRTGKGSINGGTTATIGFWNSNNVSLDFGGSGNDIYYSYNGTAYSLWTIVNKHFSDRRLKENIVDCKHKALDYIHQFQFKEYDWKKQEDRQKQAHTKIGLIAQEVQVVDPTLVYENGDTLNLDNLRLTNIALKAIQELALENRKLTHRLEKLENEYRTA